MREYAQARVQLLLAAVLANVEGATRVPGADSIHALRVSIRRLQQALRIFAQYLPSPGAKKIRRELKQVMDLSGEVRNRDIAISLLEKAQYNTTRFRGERLAAKRNLTRALKRIARLHARSDWQNLLKVELS